MLGKTIGGGLPVAAIGGRADIMAGVAHTWISSTLATEFVSLAAARATLTVLRREDVPRRLGETGQALLAGLRRVAEQRPDVIAEVLGMPQLCFCRFRNEPQGPALARAAARRGLLFKRSAYNFVSLAHRPGDIALTVEILAEAADVIRTVVRSADIACRVGGDEFAVILPESGQPEAEQLYGRLQAALEARPIGEAGRIHLSAGVAELAKNDDSRAFFERADDALYGAKEAGKGRAVAAADKTA